MDWAQLISTLGFPIVCVMGLAYFVWTFTNKIMTENKERETKYIEMMTQTNILLASCQETNAKFVEQLESMQSDVKELSEDVNDIKNVLEINNRKDD